MHNRRAFLPVVGRGGDWAADHRSVTEVVGSVRSAVLFDATLAYFAQAVYQPRQYLLFLMLLVVGGINSPNDQPIIAAAAILSCLSFGRVCLGSRLLLQLGLTRILFKDCAWRIGLGFQVVALLLQM